MTCKYCIDEDGLPCLPIYGLAPHVHEHQDSRLTFGATRFLPEIEWPEEFVVDPESKHHGTWFCPYCKDGLEECREST